MSTGSPTPVALANANDMAALVARLRSNDPQRVANRYLLYALNQATDPKAFMTSAVLKVWSSFASASGIRS